MMNSDSSPKHKSWLIFFFIAFSFTTIQSKGEANDIFVFFLSLFP